MSFFVAAAWCADVPREHSVCGVCQEVQRTYWSMELARYFRRLGARAA